MEVSSILLCVFILYSSCITCILCAFMCNFLLFHSRSVLPQHFNSFDGHYQYGDNFTDCNKFTKRPNQNYNKAIDHAFDMYCNNTQKTHANKYEVECTMNQTSEEYRTVYNFFKTNNCTKRRKEVEDDNPIKTGAILRWNIADLFGCSTVA